VKVGRPLNIVTREFRRPVIIVVLANSPVPLGAVVPRMIDSPTGLRLILLPKETVNTPPPTDTARKRPPPYPTGFKATLPCVAMLDVSCPRKFVLFDSRSK